MEPLLRKYLWAIDLGVIAICAIFRARATATLIQSSMTRGAPPVRAAPRPVKTASSTMVYPKEIEDILKRNIFCSTCPPILAAPVDPAQPPPEPTEQRTSLPIKLL